MAREHDGFMDIDFDAEEPDEAPTSAVADDDDDVELHGQFFDGLGT